MKILLKLLQTKLPKRTGDTYQQVSQILIQTGNAPDELISALLTTEVGRNQINQNPKLTEEIIERAEEKVQEKQEKRDEITQEMEKTSTS